jgi:hypothetical protein
MIIEFLVGEGDIGAQAGDTAGGIGIVNYLCIASGHILDAFDQVPDAGFLA